MPTRDPLLTDGLDVAWIIELWKALHGDDHDSQTVAAEAIAALSQYLECSPSACLSQPFNRSIC
ncbi:MAG: hypothetical protein LAO24_12215 [Acidobacteriia bacterium]|nr:hypothetical protein [Terriglobia bacterium]